MKRYSLGATIQGQYRDGCMVEDASGEWVKLSDLPEVDAIAAIREHNAGCDSSCEAQRPNERQSGGCGYQRHDGTLIYGKDYGGRLCPNCPKDWKIEWPSSPRGTQLESELKCCGCWSPCRMPDCVPERIEPQPNRQESK